VPYLNNYHLTLGIWLITMGLTIRKSYSPELIKHLIPYTGIILISCFSTIFFDHSFYNVFRDFTYLIKPIVGLICGYQLFKNLNYNPFKVLVYIGLIIAIVHLSFIVITAIQYKIINIHELRHHTGYFSDFEVYAFVFLLFHKRFLKDEFTRIQIITFSIIIGLSFVLYVSRANYIQIVLFILIFKGYFDLKKKNLIVLGSILLTTIIGYTVIYNMNLNRNGKGLEALLFKIKNAPIEAFKTQVKKGDWQDFNDNFRSYETIVTIDQVEREGVFSIIFGKGIGATADYGRLMHTNDDTYIRHAPFLHNGFTSIFLKSGLVGVFLLCFSIYLLIKTNDISTNENINNVNKLLFATGVYLIFSYWVLMGLYLKIESKSILIGIMLAYKHYLTNQETKIS
jgi:hypothetical protein